MNTFLHFLIYTNIIVALGAFSLYKVTEILFKISDLKMGFFVFFSTLFAYNYMRISDYFFNNRKRIVNNLHLHLLFNACSLIIFFSLLFSFDIYFIKLVLPVLIISLIYPLSININNKSYSLRSIPFLKVFLISFVWSYVTFLIPLIYHGYSIDYYYLDFFFQRFLFVLAIAIPFDIRDRYIDKIKTLPNTIGVFNTQVFAWFCLFIIQVLLIIDLINNTIALPLFCALFLSIELTSLTIYFSNSSQSKFFYGIIVEGLSIIMCLFVLFASWFL